MGVRGWPVSRHAALATAIDDLPGLARRTLTWDQGMEMARHDLLADLFDAKSSTSPR